MAPLHRLCVRRGPYAWGKVQGGVILAEAAVWCARLRMKSRWPLLSHEQTLLLFRLFVRSASERQPLRANDVVCPRAPVEIGDFLCLARSSPLRAPRIGAWCVSFWYHLRGGVALAGFPVMDIVSKLYHVWHSVEIILLC